MVHHTFDRHFFYAVKYEAHSSSMSRSDACSASVKSAAVVGVPAFQAVTLKDMEPL